MIPFLVISLAQAADPLDAVVDEALASEDPASWTAVLTRELGARQADRAQATRLADALTAVTLLQLRPITAERARPYLLAASHPDPSIRQQALEAARAGLPAPALPVGPVVAEELTFSGGAGVIIQDLAPTAPPVAAPRAQELTLRRTDEVAWQILDRQGQPVSSATFGKTVGDWERLERLRRLQQRDLALGVSLLTGAALAGGGGGLVLSQQQPAGAGLVGLGVGLAGGGITELIVRAQRAQDPRRLWTADEADRWISAYQQQSSAAAGQAP